jgi:Zn2+/Cd2+-exporting ATPase
MDCVAEEQVIRRILGSQSQVISVEVNLVNRTLTVEHRHASDVPLRDALRKVGLPASDARPADGLPDPQRIGKAELLLGFGLVLAVSAEAVAYFTGDERSPAVLLVALSAIALGGLETFQKGVVAVRTFTLNINFLMSVAVVGAFLIGAYAEAAMVTVLFAIAERIESFSLARAKNAVRALMKLAPETAIALRDGGWTEVRAAEVLVGEVVRARPGDRFSLDGEVVRGESSVDQGPITGESLPVAKATGDPVFAGTINGDGALEYRVTNTKGSTLLDRIVHTVQEAQGARAPTQRFIDRFATVYTPVVLMAAVVLAVTPGLFFSQPMMPWTYKALVLLVIACPCALVISTPVTIVSGLAAAARLGILVKGGAHLESGRILTTIAVDKTGTLTRGEPAVVAVRPLNGHDERRIRQIAASIDSASAHPVAKAIVAAWAGPHLPVEAFQAVPGRGAKAKLEGQVFSLGNHRLVEESAVCGAEVHEVLQSDGLEGASIVILANETEVMGLFSVTDTVRPESIESVEQLHRLGIKVVMLTGDNESTARKVASIVGIDEVHADMLPEHKLIVVQELQAGGKQVGMVGDGVNDAPALAAATVGFAMGAAGTDVAIETADVALMDDDLRKLPAYISLSRRVGSVLVQNIGFSLLVKFTFFALALSGHATLWMAVFADLGASLIVVGNGMRLISPTRLAQARAA